MLKKKKKKKNQYLAHMIKTLVICKKYIHYKIKICTLLSLNNMLRKVYKNFQRGINLQIFGAL